MESNTGSTGGVSVVVGDADPDDARRNRWRLLFVTGLIVALFLRLAYTVELPYYRIAPGSAVDTALLVTVAEDRDHRPEGQVLLTTVSLGKVTLLEAVEGWLDPGVDVVKERLIAPPGVDEDELRERNLADMEESKNKAIGVAFEALGFDAVSGEGAEVVVVVPGTPAHGALSVGDTIVAVDGQPVTVDYEAVRLLGARAPGEAAVLAVDPGDGGAQREITVVLTEHPDEAGRGFLGVSLSTKDVRFDFPFEVELRSERIGGPSAGLAFTLEIIDVLTEGELTGGRRVATTGTIELDGSVGAVGGVAQKTLAVKRSGVDLFLVPSGELERARRFAGDDLRVEAVDTLDDALEVLASVGGNGLALPKLAEAPA
jgi:PDZ domain-containing protein